MAKISTYPIVSIPTLNDLLIGTDVENLNETKNFSIGDIGGLIGQGFVPYVGATGNVNLGAFSITAASFIVPGGLATQFVKADGSLDSTAYTPQTRTLTINGVTYNLSANRSWDLNTIDTLTTTGTSGAATYIGKTLNIPQYQAQGSYITQLSGEATAVGPGNATVTLSNSAVIGKILTGLNVTGGTVVSTDTILQAFGKVQNQINGLAGGVEYQGVWNAATNTPFLQSSVGVQGYYYVVNVAGNTNLNGITDWQVGDWAIFNGSTWDKVDNTDAVVSVNGYVGAVVLTASDVGAVPTTRTLTINGVGYNLSADRSWTVGDVRTDQTYANPSWITSLAWTKITGTPTTLAGYGITNGALNTTTLTINGVTFDLTANRTWNVGTVTSIATTGPLTGGTITGSGTIGITQAGASSDGYLSSTDWNTFNGKQGAISVTAPLTFVAGVVGITQSGAATDGYLSSTDWNTFNNKVGGSGTPNTLPMWGSSTSLINSPLSYASDTFNFQYNSATGGTVVFTNSNGTAYAYTIQMNNFGSPRSTIHSYTDGLVIQSIGGTQVSRIFANGNMILGAGTVDNGYKLEITGNLYVNSIVNATTDTDRFIVSDGGIIKYRTGAEVLADIGAQGSLTLTTTGTSGASTLIGNTLNIPQYTDQFVGTVTSVGLSMPSAFSVSNSPITSSGTIAVTGAGTASQYVRGDGTLADFPSGGGGGGSSVSYYLNGSVSQGTIGGVAYRELSKVPILGAGTDININANGYIASFITDAGDPNLLEIPAGNWNFETYFSASSGGGSPTFYVELYKYDGTTFTLIASNSGTPELIAFGTNIQPYFSALAVPQTTLLATDRIAVRYYVIHSGRTITLHTENGHLCQIITTFTTGLTALNGLTAQVQYFQVGTSGTDFNIASATATHNFNLPTASAVNRGALSSADWAIFNGKQNAITLTTTGTSGASTLVGSTLNIPNYGSALTGYVPYTGATQSVNLGVYGLTANGIVSSSIYADGAGTNAGQIYFKHNSVFSLPSGYGSIGSGNSNEFKLYQVTNLGVFRGATLSLGNITASNTRDYAFPDASGTIALVGGAGVGTVTSVSFSLGSSGTDLSASVANSTTTPAITLNVPTASASARGALSAADWTTFNSKQNALTLTTTGTSGVSTLIGSTLNIPNYTTDLSGYVTLDTTQTITGFKTILRGGDVLNFKIGTDTLYGLKIAYNQNELVPSGEATWSFVNTFNRNGTGYETTPISFFRGVLVTGERLLSASINANLLDYYGNNPSGRYPIYAYNTGVQQFASSIIVGETAGVVNPATGAIADLPAGVVANFKGRVIGSNAVNNNEFATLGQVTSTSRAAISLTTTGTSGPATYSSVTGVLNIPEYQGGVTSFNTRTGAVTLTSSDVTTALGYTPVTDARTLTINGVTYDLTANRTWTVGVNPSAREIQTYVATSGQTTFTVTGGYTVGLVDVFINGVRLTSSDYTATNGTTVVLTVGTMVGNIVDIIKYTSGIVNSISGTGTTNELAYFTGSTVIASLSTATYPSLTELSYVKGVTSSIQTQLNSKQAAGTYVTSVTGTSPIVSSGGTTPAISIPVATTSVNGYLSSTDWTTFNGKQNALTNPVTGTGTTNYLPKFTGSTTIGNSIIQDSGSAITITGSNYLFNLSGGGTSRIAASINNTSGNLELGLEGSVGNQLFTGMAAYQAGIGTSNNTSLNFATNTVVRMQLNTSGNLGLGVTPSASQDPAMQSRYGLYIGNDEINVMNNAFFNAGFKYVVNGFANRYYQNIYTGGHQWLTAPSGTAGNAITFTQAMTLTSGGNVLIGTTTDNGARLQVSGVSFGLSVTGSNGAIAGTGLSYINNSDDAFALVLNNNGLSNQNDRGVFEVRRQGNSIFRINNTGNVGIGTASPSSKLTVLKTITTNVGATGNAALSLGTAGSSGEYNLINFGYDAGTWQPAYLGYLTTSGSGSSNGALVFGTRNLTTDSQPTERMRITSGGNVEINSAGELRVYRSDNARYGTFYTDNSNVNIASSVDPIALTSPERIVFNTAGTERMRITSDNNVLFNTISTSTTNSSSFIFRSGTGAYSGVMIMNHATTNNTGAGFIDCYYNTSYIGGVAQNGASNVSFLTSSDYRLKEDFQDFDGLKLISNLKVYDFKWKEEESRMYGVLAHELQKVVPYTVSGDKDEIKENGKIKVQVVDYSKLVPILIKAIQELQAKLDKNNIN